MCRLPLSQVLATLVGRGDETSTLVLVEFRLPRLVLGVLVGMALGLSGALFQSVLRNPLASPDIIGITEGASVGAVYALLILGLGGVAVSVAALIGAASSAGSTTRSPGATASPATASCCAGSGSRSSRPASSATCSPAATPARRRQALVWLSGHRRRPTGTATPGSPSRWSCWCPPRSPSRPGWGCSARRRHRLGLGVPAQRVRPRALAVGTALAAVATAAAGPVAFVALLAAPIARRLVGHGSLALIPPALVGVAIVTASDLVAQHLIPDVQVPVGISPAWSAGPT